MAAVVEEEAVPKMMGVVGVEVDAELEVVPKVVEVVVESVAAMVELLKRRAMAVTVVELTLHRETRVVSPTEEIAVVALASQVTETISDARNTCCNNKLPVMTSGA